MRNEAVSNDAVKEQQVQLQTLFALNLLNHIPHQQFEATHRPKQAPAETKRDSKEMDRACDKPPASPTRVAAPEKPIELPHHGFSIASNDEDASKKRKSLPPSECDSDH